MRINALIVLDMVIIHESVQTTIPIVEIGGTSGGSQMIVNTVISAAVMLENA
jgi:hypothetical protein